MLTQKQKERIERGRREFGRRLRCTKCGTTMRDTEPCGIDGEFLHPRNGCTNGGVNFSWTPPAPGARRAFPERYKERGIIQVIEKKAYRARRRGAKRASKLRPKT